MLPGCHLRRPGRRPGGTAWPGQRMSASLRRTPSEQVLSFTSTEQIKGTAVMRHATLQLCVALSCAWVCKYCHLSWHGSHISR